MRKSFVLAFKIIIGKARDVATEDIKKAYLALTRVSNTLLAMGILVTVISFAMWSFKMRLRVTMVENKDC